MVDDKPLMRLSEAAEYLGVSRRWLYRRIWSGELPASKIGGLYFVRKEDLDALVRPVERGAEAEVLPDEGLEREFLKCGYCFRLITHDTQVGDVCQAPECDALLCATCWSEGHRYCVHHLPDRETRWRQAVARYRTGEYPVLLRSEQARFREVHFLERLRLRLSQITAVRYPQGDRVITVDDWAAIEEYEDERGHLMDLLGVVALDEAFLTRYPLNPRLHYRLPAPKRKVGRKAQAIPFVIEVWVVSHLETMVQQGFDTQPFAAEELRALLLHLVSEVEERAEFRLVLLASTTGWSRDARDIITGEGSERPFVHRYLWTYLYDMEVQQLYYNPLDPRLSRYAHLFEPALPAERAKEAAEAVEQLMERFDTLTLAEALQVLPYEEPVLRAAFEELAASGNFALVTLPPENQWAIVRK